MNSPRILDAKGRELSKGDRVVRHFPSGVSGTIVGEVLASTKLDVLIEWAGPNPSHRFYKPQRDSLLRRTYRCPDLELLQSPRQEAATAANERSSASERG